MARRIPEHRFDDLVRGATRVFIEAGYRRTQMADVAEAVGVAKGTLYGYVESKDALFALCLAFSDASEPIPLPDPLPLPTPPPGEIGRRIAEAVGREVRLPRLEAAMTAPAPAVDDAGREAREIVAELFDLMHANRFGIKLLDRCMDHPEVQGLWQTHGREDVRSALGAYLEHRAASGHLRVFDDVRLGARMVIEICTTWAVHIHWDRAPETYDAGLARANAIEFAVRGLLA